MATHSGIFFETQSLHLYNRGYNPSASVAKLLEGAKRTMGGAKKMAGGAKMIVGRGLRMMEEGRG